MSTESSPSPPSDGFRLWLLLAIAAAVAAGLFSAPRIKPLVVFAAGLGLVLGVVLRFLADWLAVPRTRRVTVTVMLLAAAAFAMSFGLGYRREALAWKQAHDTGPDNPLAAALLKSFPDVDSSELIAGQRRFTFSDYLGLRVPWPSPWPEVLISAEALFCVLIAGFCVRRAPARGASKGH